MGLGRALMWRGLFEDARAAYQAALDEYKTVRDWQGLARACLGLAETYLPVGKGDEIVRWVKTALGYLDVKADPASHAQARFLLGAGLPLAGASLADAETHLAEAARLAAENDLAEVAARSRFEQGNLLAQRGNLEQAVAAFEDSVTLSLAARNQFQEVLGHNNAAYNAILLGRLELARAHIERALSLADAYALDLPRQWLYSTRGELALAERRWDEAQTWFERGMAESERANNSKQVGRLPRQPGPGRARPGRLSGGAGPARVGAPGRPSGERRAPGHPGQPVAGRVAPGAGRTRSGARSPGAGRRATRKRRTQMAASLGGSPPPPFVLMNHPQMTQMTQMDESSASSADKRMPGSEFLFAGVARERLRAGIQVLVSEIDGVAYLAEADGDQVERLDPFLGGDVAG